MRTIECDKCGFKMSETEYDVDFETISDVMYKIVYIKYECSCGNTHVSSDVSIISREEYEEGLD